MTPTIPIEAAYLFIAILVGILLFCYMGYKIQEEQKLNLYYCCECNEKFTTVNPSFTQLWPTTKSKCYRCCKNEINNDDKYKKSLPSKRPDKLPKRKS